MHARRENKRVRYVLLGFVWSRVEKLKLMLWGIGIGLEFRLKVVI